MLPVERDCLVCSSCWCRPSSAPSSSRSSFGATLTPGFTSSTRPNMLRFASHIKNDLSIFLSLGRSRTRTPTCRCPPLTGEAGAAPWGWAPWARWAPPSTSAPAPSTPRPRPRPITALSMVTAQWGDTGPWPRCLDRNQTG